jgi:hypothetical protein
VKNTVVSTSAGLAINSAGTIVGYSAKYSGDKQVGNSAVLWPAGQTTPIELGDLGTPPGVLVESEARAINDAGVAVGMTVQYGVGQWALRWDAGQTQPTLLGNLDQGTGGIPVGSRARAVNAAGDAVGEGTGYHDWVALGYRAILWRHDGVAALDLNDAIRPGSRWNLQRAFGINDQGVIVGLGQITPDDGGLPFTSAFRLTPASPGDATADGRVDFADLVVLAQHYDQGGGGSTWWAGDFTGDGRVDFADLVKLSQNYNGNGPGDAVPGASPEFAGDVAAAFATVPEPAALLALAAPLLLLRRSRRD